jgi:hypothetical protein
MAVTVVKEDGTGLANANSYADEADALAYLESTGRKDAWTAFSGNDRRAALIVATQYMDDTYVNRYLGIVSVATQDTQALLWPRDELTLPSGADLASNLIPPEVAQACAEDALVAATDGIDPNPTYDPSGRSVKVSKVRVEGAVSKETEFDGGTRPVVNRRHPAAERVLRKWLTPSSRLLLRA